MLFARPERSAVQLTLFISKRLDAPAPIQFRDLNRAPPTGTFGRSLGSDDLGDSDHEMFILAVDPAVP